MGAISFHASPGKNSKIRLKYNFTYRGNVARFTYSTGITVPNEVFGLLHRNPTAKDKATLQRYGLSTIDLAILKNTLAGIEKHLYNYFLQDQDPTPDKLRKYLDEQLERKQATQSNDPLNISFTQYIEHFINKVDRGEILTPRGTEYKNQSTKNLRVFQKVIIDFSSDVYTPDWTSLDSDFKTSFLKYLYRKGFTQNYIVGLLARLKRIVHHAQQNGIEAAKQVDTSIFKGSYRPSDEIALTNEEVNLLFNASLTGSEAKARDLFLIGVFTAQRVSDFIRLTPENFSVIDGIECVTIHQLKEDVRVVIPVNSRLKQIMERNGYYSPTLSEQKINQHIKVVAKKAGIDGSTIISEVRSGKRSESKKLRSDMITTHTARRTGATLLYNSGLGVKSLMQITGHKKVSTLMDYIKIKMDGSSINMLKNTEFFQ